MNHLDICSKSKRMLGFLIDRAFLFTIWFFLLTNTSFMNIIYGLKDSLYAGDFWGGMKFTILIPIVGYLYLLVIYFFYFVIFHYFTNTTIGKFLMKIQLVVIKDNEPVRAKFPDLLKRFFYLYISGLGALGYLYPFHKSKESKYDEPIKMYVVNRTK